MRTLASDLETPYRISDEQRRSFRERGYIKLKEVLAPETLAHYGERFATLVRERAKSLPPLEQRGTYGKAFQQIINLWSADEVAREFVFSKRLARIAAELMGVDGVRLWHDQALYKEPGGGFTPWHADQVYWPMATERSCTVWVPFQAVPLEMGPLSFSIGSHRADFGRTMPISDDSEQVVARKVGDLPYDETPFDLGEVSYHYGWTFHRAPPNRTARMRAVMTVIYMEDGMRLAEPRNREQENDWKGFCPESVVGGKIETKLNPKLY